MDLFHPVLRLRLVTSVSLTLALALTVSACASSQKSQTTPDEITGSPQSRALAWVQLANSQLSDGDPVAALQSLESAERIKDNLPEIYHSRALALYQRKEPALALEAARKAVALNPKYSDGSTTLGKLLFDMGKYAEAEKVLLVPASDPTYADSYKPLTTLGILYYRAGRYDQAKQKLTRAVEFAPQASCLALYYLGHIHLRESNLKTAIKEYDQSTRGFCATFGEGHLALGMALTRDKQFDRARKKYVEIQERFPRTKVAEQALDQMKYLP